MMARYRNGRWPGSALVWFWAKNQYGKRERFRATPGTAARILAAIADAKASYGFDLRITSGPNVYRDFAGQVHMADKYGIGQAAKRGTSSHGGLWEGRDCLAVDFWNAQQLIDKIGRAEFNRLMKRHGLTPFLISRARGYARTENWHVIDLNPFASPTVGGIGAIMATAKQIWSFKVHRNTGDVSAIQELADAKSNTMTLLDLVGKTLKLTADPVKRGGKHVSVRQDNADTGTLVREVLATVKAQKAAIEALAVAKGADPDAIAKAVEDGVKQAMKDVSFTVETD